MPTGVSLKTRNRIDRKIGIWKKKSERRSVILIGSEGWNNDVRATLEKLRTHKFYCLDPLDRSSYPVNKFEASRFCRPAPQIPRKVEARSRGLRHQLAFYALNGLLGWTVDFRIPSGPSDNYIRPGKLDARLDWLLDEIYTLPKGSRPRNFMVTIARDANVWPAPKWWLVTRRLLGDNRPFAKRSRAK